MASGWSERDEQEFERQRTEDMCLAYRTALVLAVILFPLFSGLDYLTQREFLGPLSWVRFGTSGLYLVLLFLDRRKLYPGRPALASFLVLLLAAISLTWMTILTGGAESHYYAGLNLVIAASALFPWRAWHTAGLSTTIAGLYAAAVLVFGDFRDEELPVFINNLYFIVSTAAIASAVTWFSDRLRRRGYAAILEKKALDSRDRFISEASHELRTPLTALQLQIGLIERLLTRSPADQKALVEGTATLRKQARRLARLVDEMLDLSRIRAGKLELRLQPMDLSAAIGLCVETQQSHFADRGVALECQIEEGLWAVADEFRLDQVITNLLSNALKYGEGKPVSLRAWGEASDVWIEVRDRGAGIPVDPQPYIFERFERGAAPANVSGLGLGLFIARQIILAHSGTIQLQSGAGEGSAFRVRLPRHVQ